MGSDEDSTFRTRRRTSVRDDTDHPVEALLAWFSDNKGWLNPHVRVIHDEPNGFHVVASKALSSPTVARCPLSLTLSYLCLDHSQNVVPHVHSPLQKCLGRVPDFVLNYLFLVEQRCLRDKSPWHPYIACLPGPETMATPIWFTDEDLEFLQGTNLLQSTKERHRGLREQWEQAQIVLAESGVAMPSESNFETFRWAATIMTSRAFISDHILPDRPTFPILFPIVDILNHSVEARVEWDFHPYQDFALNILQDVKEGDEIFNNYAPKQNDELLMGYGFCVENNPMEQFAIRMTIPPEIVQEVSGDGKLSQESIAFGMPQNCLDGDQMKEQHFLRIHGHPLGRYENIIPCFRGFAPYLVHTSFLVALHTRHMKLADVKFPNTGARVFLGTLMILYRALQGRCQRLPLTNQSLPTPSNDKQKYAVIYRDGQAKIIHTMRLELKSVLDKRRVHNAIPTEPAIITTTEALFALKADFPDHYQDFKDAILSEWGIEVRNSAQYAHDVATADVEDLVWVLLLIVLATITLTSHHDTLPHQWLEDLFSSYPLPTTSFIDSDSNYDHIHMILRKLSKRGNATFLLVSDLHDLGRSLITSAGSTNPGISKAGPMDGLREKIILWALRVVESERIELPDHSQPELIRQCMYMRPFRSDREDESWMFEEFDIEEESQG